MIVIPMDGRLSAEEEHQLCMDLFARFGSRPFLPQGRKGTVNPSAFDIEDIKRWLNEKAPGYSAWYDDARRTVMIVAPPKIGDIEFTLMVGGAAP